jgi:hypothetical protein
MLSKVREASGWINQMLRPARLVVCQRFVEGNSILSVQPDPQYSPERKYDFGRSEGEPRMSKRTLGTQQIVDETNCRRVPLVCSISTEAPLLTVP